MNYVSMHTGLAHTRLVHAILGPHLISRRRMEKGQRWEKWAFLPRLIVTHAPVSDPVWACSARAAAADNV